MLDAGGGCRGAGLAGGHNGDGDGDDDGEEWYPVSWGPWTTARWLFTWQIRVVSFYDSYGLPGSGITSYAQHLHGGGDTEDGRMSDGINPRNDAIRRFHELEKPELSKATAVQRAAYAFFVSGGWLAAQHHPTERAEPDSHLGQRLPNKASRPPTVIGRSDMEQTTRWLLVSPGSKPGERWVGEQKLYGILRTIYINIWVKQDNTDTANYIIHIIRSVTSRPHQPPLHSSRDLTS
ncbi:hypothetical protein MGYG_06545 [Nannizzia gypsea CBS 118893]|uniref:Uncharacterized protein n=1 Tax=Arthroderma gypseum (strain ATCC MYA-4604 / CBS 118893) TaxID=535722 RepID=E4UZL9_ARTGP|nr:hypothetical protein MGYG_06545 [Nannizzia gypsea CBS 118893]EFR03549.1 hypothetical protein MGYG_06545 [Nannizzia gypsea CBS 118893]